MTSSADEVKALKETERVLRKELARETDEGKKHGSRLRDMEEQASKATIERLESETYTDNLTAKITETMAYNETLIKALAEERAQTVPAPVPDPGLRTWARVAVAPRPPTAAPSPTGTAPKPREAARAPGRVDARHDVCARTDQDDDVLGPGQAAATARAFTVNDDDSSSDEELRRSGARRPTRAGIVGTRPAAPAQRAPVSVPNQTGQGTRGDTTEGPAAQAADQPSKGATPGSRSSADQTPARELGETFGSYLGACFAAADENGDPKAWSYNSQLQRASRYPTEEDHSRSGRCRSPCLRRGHPRPLHGRVGIRLRRAGRRAPVQLGTGRRTAGASTGTGPRHCQEAGARWRGRTRERQRGGHVRARTTSDSRRSGPRQRT